MTLQEAYGTLDGVRDEYHAAKFSLRQSLRDDYDKAVVNEDGSRQLITHHQFEECARNLPITYLVRLFGEFEGILRDYWSNGRRRSSQPRMTDLMNSIAAYCFMNRDDVQDAHEVREYRNQVIHEHLLDPRFDFQTCRSRLARFVRWLPRKW